MRYRLFIFTVILLLISCDFSSKKGKNMAIIDFIESKQEITNEDLNVLKSDYGDNLILKAFYFIDREENLNIYNWDKLELENDWINFEDKIDSILKKYPNIINEVFNQVANKPNKETIVKHIIYWCDTYILIQLHTRYNSIVYFEKIIYEIPLTNDLVINFFVNKSQNWDSLSTSQIYELYYKVCNRIYKLSDQEKVQFYSIFLKLLSKQME